jgi:hypothetical protein
MGVQRDQSPDDHARFPALKDPNPSGQRDGMPVGAELHAGRRDHLDRPEPGQSLRGMAVG